MPIFTSLLFFFLVLALLPLLLRGSRRRQSLREQAELDDRMTLGASICIAAAREAFGVELDLSPTSIGTLDGLITKGWSDVTGLTPEPSDNKDSNDLVFVFAAYLGTVFTKHTPARWRIENGKPALYFLEANISAFPLDLAERKLQDPEHVNLEQETSEWGKFQVASLPESHDGATE